MVPYVEPNKDEKSTDLSSKLLQCLIRVVPAAHRIRYICQHYANGCSMLFATTVHLVDIHIVAKFTNVHGRCSHETGEIQGEVCYPEYTDPMLCRMLGWYVSYCLLLCT